MKNKIIIYWDTVESEFRPLLIAHTKNGICAIMPACEQDGIFEKIFPANEPDPYEHQLVYSPQFAQKIAKQIEMGNTNDIKLDIIVGTEFQKKVWSALLTIPRGETRTYSQIAEMIGSPKAVRAVGTACRKNPIAILIPCHRAVPKSGGLGNYRWGIKMKQQLLNNEKIVENPDQCIQCKMTVTPPYPQQYNDKNLPICKKCYEEICLWNL